LLQAGENLLAIRVRYDVISTNTRLCPSCTARRMADTAAHLVDHVLPRAPYRQWVFTVPRALRLRLARDPAWATWVGNLAVRAIGAWQLA
jgi:hypothetical protein